MDEVVPNVWVGDASTARKIVLGEDDSTRKFTHVLDASDEEHYTDDESKHKVSVFKANMCDHGSTLLSEKNWTVLNESLSFIDKALEAKGKVLIHCYAGVSRSATMCVAWLMSSKRWTVEKALGFLQGKRSQVFPIAYAWQSCEWEHHLTSDKKLVRLYPLTS